jgi:branched-chain amino acid transport system substrate-binding protein
MTNSRTMARYRLGTIRSAILAIVFFFLLIDAANAGRLALVIGNRDYTVGALKNPINDASAMAEALASLGFQVTSVRNLKRDDIGRTLENFASRIRPGDDVVVFYAGHGMQVKGVNYLPAVDANIRVESDVALNSLNLNQLLDRLDEAKAGVRLLLIDACRDNPYSRGFRSGSRGLARQEGAPSGTLMHFATRPGGVAADGTGTNGLYTGQLLKHLRTPGLAVESMLKRVAAGVRQESGGDQQPWTEGALDGEFYFVSAPAGAAGQVASVRPEPAPVVPSVAAPAPSELLVRIGHVGPKSGAIGHLGEDNEMGARLAIQDLNTRTVMIGGRRARFELLMEDDAGDPRLGVAAAQKLVAAGVNGVIGHLNSGTSIPAARIYSDAGIPQISPSATNPRYTRLGYKTAFRLIMDDAKLGRALGQFAVRSLNSKSIAVIDDRTAYGQGLTDEFVNGVRSAGGKVVAREFTTDNARSFLPMLRSLAAQKPDLVFFGGMDSVAGPLLREMAELGIKARFLGGDGICSSELPKLASGRLKSEAVICAEAGGATAEFKQPLDSFYTRFRSTFNRPVQVYAPYVYDAVNLMVDAMVRAGSADPARYLSALASTRSYKGVTGPIDFDENGDLVNGAFTLYTFRGSGREQLAVMR